MKLKYYIKDIILAIFIIHPFIFSAFTSADISLANLTFFGLLIYIVFVMYNLVIFGKMDRSAGMPFVFHTFATSLHLHFLIYSSTKHLFPFVFKLKILFQVESNNGSATKGELRKEWIKILS
jgi:hypothetical protein